MPATVNAAAPQTGSPAATVVNHSGKSKIVLVCEHASKHLPSAFGDLGLTEEAKKSHAAWDIGAQAVAEYLSQKMDATLVLGSVSRLIYDCNRAPSAQDAIPTQSERFFIPGNRHLTDEEKNKRIGQVYKPFHSTVAHAIDRAGPGTILVTVHSFTPIYNGVERHTEVGLIYYRNCQLAKAMCDNAKHFFAWNIELNEPYSERDGVTHMLERHGTANDQFHVMIEIRNDLIKATAEQQKIAGMLTKLLNQSLQTLGRSAQVRETP